MRRGYRSSDRRKDYARTGFAQLSLPPMSKHAERLAFARLHAGDPRMLEFIVRSNMSLVMSAASGFYIEGYEPEDVLMLGVQGLLTAIKKYDPERGAKFSTVAVPWIRQRIQYELRRYPFGDGIRRSITRSFNGDLRGLHDALKVRVPLDKIMRERDDGAFGDILAPVAPEVCDEELEKERRVMLLESLLNVRDRCYLNRYILGKETAPSTGNAVECLSRIAETWELTA